MANPNFQRAFSTLAVFKAKQTRAKSGGSSSERGLTRQSFISPLSAEILGAELGSLKTLGSMERELCQPKRFVVIL